MMTGSRVLGAALAGLLITTVGYGWAFVVDAVSYVAVLAALCRGSTTRRCGSPRSP